MTCICFSLQLKCELCYVKSYYRMFLFIYEYEFMILVTIQFMKIKNVMIESD